MAPVPALLRPLASASGIELVPKLHKTALKAEQTLRSLLAGPGAAATGLGSRDDLAAARQTLAALGPSGLRLCCGDSFRGGVLHRPEHRVVEKVLALRDVEPVGGRAA